jgi:hypothetical protein
MQNFADTQKNVVGFVDPKFAPPAIFKNKWVDSRNKSATQSSTKMPVNPAEHGNHHKHSWSQVISI